MQAFRFFFENKSWLAAGILLTFMSCFGQTFFISIFGGQIRSEFDLSHAAWGGIYSLGTSVSAIVMIWSGVLSDFFKTKLVGSLVLLGFAVSVYSMAILKSVFLLPFVIFALRLFGQGMCSHLAIVAMSRWFYSNRGRALAVAGLGFSFGEAFLPMIFVSAMVFLEWQQLWFIAAILILISIPILWSLLKSERTPNSLSQENISLGMQGKHWKRNEAIRHPLFWYMFPALIGPGAFSTAFFFQQVHFSEVKGWEHILLVSFFPLFTASSVLMMLFSGWAIDRYGTSKLISFHQIPIMVAFICFGFCDDIALFVLGLIFLSMTAGATSTLPNAFWAEFYGTANIGSIKALAAAIMVFGSALGPGLTGMLIDKGVNIEIQYIIVSGFFCISSLTMFIGVRKYEKDLNRDCIIV